MRCNGLIIILLLRKVITMKNLRLEDHPYFTPFTDPQSGVTSFILTERIAPIQQAFYFTNYSVTDDGKYMWFYCSFPPSTNQTLGVVCLDAEAPFIRHYPQAAFDSASPLIRPDGKGVYFCVRDEIHTIDLDGSTRLIAALPKEFTRNRHVFSMATHLTISADGVYLLFDCQVGGSWAVGQAEIATGEIEIFHTFARRYNHLQASPVDPELFLLDQDWFYDVISGEHFNFDQRIWLMDTKGKRFEPLLPDHWYQHNSRDCHDFWAKDGHLCWVDYDHGAYECDIISREITHVWKRPLCHAHTSTDRRYWVADQDPYQWNDITPCEVIFYDRQSNREINIYSALPASGLPRLYHFDPHPAFTPDDRFIVCSTTAGGNLDISLTPVENILSRI